MGFLFIKCYTLLSVSLFLFLASSLPECFMDCDVALKVELQGKNLSADCRCWKACSTQDYSPEALKVVEEYKHFEPKHFRKGLYVRRDCKDAFMTSGEVDDIDLLLEKLWAKDGDMFRKTTEHPHATSVSAPKDWVLAEANYHCPTTRQSSYVRRQIKHYRYKATGGRALFFHRDCQRVRYAYGLSSPEEARDRVLRQLSRDNHPINEWFLYDWNQVGFCSSLTHRVRHELRDLSKTEQELFFTAMNEAYRRGLYHMHSPYHSQQLMYAYGHGTPGFTQYHRLAILHIEEHLRGLHPKNRCLTVPYWNWGRDADASKHSTFFTKELVGTVENITSQKNCGKDGNGCCVLDGQFAGWRDMYGQCLKRNFVLLPLDKTGLPNNNVVLDLVTKYTTFGFGKYGISIYTSGIVGNVLDDCIEQCGDDADAKGTCTPLCHGLISTKKVRGFTGDLELSHNRVHFSVGGHMFASNSPNDPLFLLNHGFVDKVFDRWQRCQGKTNPLYWCTIEEHFADAFTHPGLYGLSDRILGWSFTIGEAAFGRHLGYTSYEYADDPWEIEAKLPTQCSGWDQSKKFDDNYHTTQLTRSQMIFNSSAPSLDDTSAGKSKESLNPPGLLETQEHIDKQQLKRRKRVASK